MGDLASPVVDQVEVDHEEVARLGLRPHDKVVLALFEEPLGLGLVEDETAFLDLVQFDDVARLVRKLTLVRNPSQ